MMAVSNSATTSRSDVWKYISKDSSSASATCTLCEKVLAYCGGTSNLWDHFLCSHPREYHHEDKQQSTLNSIVKIQRIRSSFPVKGECSNGGVSPFVPPLDSKCFPGSVCHCVLPDLFRSQL